MVDLEEIKTSFEFFDDWEEKYRFILDIGKSLPPFPDSQKTEENIVRGCQSQVWLVSSYDPKTNRLQLEIDSDAHIVKGLIAIVQSAYANASPGEILEFDIEGLFDELRLFSHLSATRGNGLRAMVQRIRAEARMYRQ
ncbi:MAG: SufE family protein [Gammaproteobacteria bacterium]|nr:SufE family protein [Gammaproteobacteria bacterium]